MLANIFQSGGGHPLNFNPPRYIFMQITVTWAKMSAELQGLCQVQQKKPLNYSEKNKYVTQKDETP